MPARLLAHQILSASPKTQNCLSAITVSAWSAHLIAGVNSSQKRPFVIWKQKRALAAKTPEGADATYNFKIVQQRHPSAIIIGARPHAVSARLHATIMSNAQPKTHLS